MADTRKPSRVVSDTLGIPPNDYGLMDINARRYERTDAGVEDAILRQIFAHPKVKEFLDNPKTDPDVKEFVYKSRPAEFGNTKVLNTAGILEALGASSAKNGRKNDEKLIELYDENPNWVRNRVRYNKDYGDVGADNLDLYIETLRDKTYGNKDKMGKAEKIAKAVLLPRVLESEMAGVDPTWKDYAGDVTENVLMALPLGNAAAALKVAGRAQKAKRILANLGAAAAVPLATEGMDAAMYSPVENPDRSDFNQYDVITHGATNLAAPFVAGRVLGRVGRMTGADKAGEEAANVAKRNFGWFQDRAVRKIMQADAKNFEKAAKAGKPFPISEWYLSGPEKIRSAEKADAIVSKVLENAPAAGGSWLMNKYGSNRDADLFLGMVGRLAASTGEDPSTWIQEGREEEATEALDNARSQYVAGLGSAVEEDETWLRKIADDPSIVRGEGEGKTAAFKNWWNTRGMNILKGTGLFGGTME